MATNSSKSGIKHRRRKTSTASRSAASARKSAKRFASKSRGQRFDKAKDQAERRTIARTFDLEAFHAAEKNTASETAKDWGTPY